MNLRLTVGGTATAARTESTSAGTAAGQGWDVNGSSGYGVAIGPRVGRTFDVGPVTLWPTLGGRYRIDRSDYAMNLSASGRTLTRAVSAAISVDVVFPIGAI